MSLAKGLNQQVANLAVLFVKLHHFHWYVKGPSFFSLHAKFEELYDEVNELYDDFAERLLTIGEAPASTLKDYLAIATLKEGLPGLSSIEMVKSLHADISQLIKEFTAVLREAQAAGDEGTADMLIQAISNFEKTNWMLRATLA